jgi:hypothetical protein
MKALERFTGEFLWAAFVLAIALSAWSLVYLIFDIQMTRAKLQVDDFGVFGAALFFVLFFVPANYNNSLVLLFLTNRWGEIGPNPNIVMFNVHALIVIIGGLAIYSARRIAHPSPKSSLETLEREVERVTNASWIGRVVLWALQVAAAGVIGNFAWTLVFPTHI